MVHDPLKMILICMYWCARSNLVQNLLQPWMNFYFWVVRRTNQQTDQQVYKKYLKGLYMRIYCVIYSSCREMGCQWVSLFVCSLKPPGGLNQWVKIFSEGGKIDKFWWKNRGFPLFWKKGENHFWFLCLVCRSLNPEPPLKRKLEKVVFSKSVKC